MPRLAYKRRWLLLVSIACCFELSAQNFVPRLARKQRWLLKHEYLMPRRIFHAEFYVATRLQATHAAI